MSRISFLVGFDRIAQSPSGSSAVGNGNEVPLVQRRALKKKGEEHLVEFWEETRLGLIRRMRRVVSCHQGLLSRF